MWRTVYVSQRKAVSAQPVHKQRALGLPARAHRSRAGLPPIQLAQALLGRPTRLISQLVRSTGSQDEADSSSTAGPLVPTPQQQNGNLPAAQSAAGGPGRVPVQFVVPEYLTHWGQVLKVVGSLEELGSWKVEKAPSMQWNEGHTWTLDIQLPVGAVNFKIVMHDQPNSNVRWELGEDRSVLIPETTTVTGAPVGQVGVTCNFNDVHNSRVEVRPDRAYLKQQLKAVEARVLAIQEKKRKLDQRMSVLTTGLKKYDATVAMLQDGVQAAVEARRSSKESAKQLQQSPQQQEPAEQQQQRQEHQQAAAASSNGATSDKQQQAASKAQASFNPLGQKASIQVPILDPSQLPSFADASAAAAAAEESTAASSTTNSSSLESSTDEAQQTADSAAVVAADSSSSSLAYVPDVSAIKASHVNETVLSATVDQLLAAAEDALARSTPSEPIPNLSVGAAGVDDAQLAEEYVEELLAAASALEQQADRRASLLLEAAQRSGDSDMAADIEQLAAAELPPIPTVEELAEAAAAAAAITVSLDDNIPTAAAAAAVSSASMSSSDEAAEAAAAAVTQPQEQQQQQQQVLMEVQFEPQQRQQQQARSGSPSPAQRVDKDGSITFTAESLSVDVDVKQLLAAVLSRVGIPLGGNVTISASFTPNEAASQDTAAAAAADAIDAAAEASMDHDVDSMAASSSSSVGRDAAHDHQQQQRQQEQKEKKPQRRLSPIEAIAAVFSRGSSMDSEDERDNSSSGGSSGGSNGRGQGFRNSSSNGASAQGKGRYGKAVSTGSEQPYTSSTTAAAAPIASNGSSSGLQQPAQTTVRMDLQDLSKQLEAKEAARRAAAERVAAALAQVEEMRRSVVAANSVLRQQLLGTEGPDSSSSSSCASTSVTAGNGSSSSSSGGGVRTTDGRVYSRYRVAYKGASQAPAAPAADAASSSSSSSSTQQGNGNKPEPVSAPGAPRGMPAIAATAVDPAQMPPKPRQAGKSAQQQQQQQHEAEVEGEVREELSLLAALAAEVQKQSRDRTQQ